MRVTVAPAASSLALASSAAALSTFSSSGFGAPSTRSLASLRPRPETISRTTLMTPIFLSPALSRMTSNSDCSSPASAAAAPPPAAGAAATATGAAAVTSKVSSNFLTNSESSSSVSSLKASSSSSVDSLAMVGPFLTYIWLRPVRDSSQVGGGC
ncbi:50S ribosomal protein L7/L12 [Mycolicibacterium phlei RIVM601174]|nr:50S ribosomal protein L7/L12 [Mycolicibacterium phlei RIVM601174]MBF4190706.1 50S ribosomal protein L7/L12 [Mycolicibacterium phlei]